jgi:RHS repeat-associated protein
MENVRVYNPPSKEPEVQSGTVATSFSAPSLPKGGGAIKGIGEKFSVNAVNGTATFTVPVYTTPSRSDFYPKLSLSYDSGSGNGPFGLGWNLSVPSVTRKTEKGLPRYREAEESDVFILSEAEDLVPALIQRGNDWKRDSRPDSADGRAYTVQRYRPRIEGLFARIERWQDQKNGDTYWKSVSKDNVTSIYGKSPSGRISDPDDSLHVFKWLLEESYDDKGNRIQYQYKKEDPRNVDRSSPQEGNRLANNSRFANHYLKYIKYGKKAPGPQDDYLFQVVFDYGEHDRDKPTVDEVAKWPSRPDPFSSFRAGFEVRTYRLCRRVLMFHRFQELGATRCLVRSTDLSYAENPVATYLTSVTQTGYIRDNQSGAYQKKSFPPLAFTYSQPTVDAEIHFIDAASLENLPIGLDKAQYQWVDLDSEGISGILLEQPNAWYYKPNRGSAHFAPVEPVATQPSLASLGSGRQQIMDLAGDGEKCLVQFSKPVAGFYERDEQGQWGPFTPFASNPNISWNDPNVKVIDLDGDGFSDILISEDQVFTWYPSRAKEGFGPSETVRKASDEEKGPALVFADPTQSVYLADMCGDGLTDIARIRNGEICYWPNMGYGRFGAKVIMDKAPVFDHPDLFDPKRIRLVDIDGSGTTDILYLGPDSVTFWANEAGNSWSDAQLISNFPPTDDLSAVTAVDLFGNGTGCLVWSSPLPQDAGYPMRYIDLMSGQKPHLLVAIKNNMGSETRLQYASSTQFYLDDLAAGTPWITKLPFPVQVVERQETRDEVTGTKLVSLYQYHHGYFDGIEREFRGFGLVEQRDTEDFAQFVGAGLFGGGPNAVEEELHVPPLHTKTWFHTGAFLDRDNISRHFVDEYYNGDSLAILLPDTNLPSGLTAREEEEACRALKGRMLRQEIYADDSTSQSRHPYSVSEHNYQIRLVQPALNNRHAVFYATDRESLDYHYERDPANPRIGHAITLEVDPYGNVTKSAAIGYPRRAPALGQPPLPPEQQQTLITYTESVFTNKPDEPDWYRIGAPVETRTYELPGFTRTGDAPYTFDAMLAAGPAATEIRYEAGPDLNKVQKRLIQRARTLYYKDDLSGPLPLGDLQSHALPYQTYQMAFTPGLINQVYGNRVSNNLLADEGKYLLQDGVWWIPSGRQIFDSAQFYLPTQFVDPFGDTSSTVYDPYSLLPAKTVDPLGNAVAAQTSYRTMLPWHITDPNNNRSAVRFDALGMVVATAVMGKQGQNEGDTLDETTPEASASDDPTTQLEYDLFNWVNHQRPNFVHTLARERHRDPNTRWQESYGYSDGFGREVMKKVQAEAGPAPARDQNGLLKRDGNGKLVLEFSNMRWVGTGRTVFNNKGKPVKKYEPFFSSTFAYEDEQDLVEWGVTPVLHYDPVERAIRTDLPDGTFSKVEFDPWRQTTWDQNDTVLESQWYSQRGSPAPTDPEPADPEKRAAWLAAKHANTPTVAHLDTLGRTFLTIADNGLAADGTPQKYPTHLTLDIEGNQRVITDALGRPAMVTDFNMLSQKIHWHSIDAGDRWVLNNVAGKPMRAWDGQENDPKTHEIRTTYDELQRPTHLFVKQGNAAEALAERSVYIDRPDSGWTVQQTQAANLRGKLYRHYDGAGVVTNEQYDFKGNLLSGNRRLAIEYKQQVDWLALAKLTDVLQIANAAAPLLESETFTADTTFDALNRPITLTTPDASVVRPMYNEANLLEQVNVNVRGSNILTPLVTNLDYNAKGQRELCECGNGVRTDYAYDPDSFRLTSLKTTRANDNALLQDLSYAYDPVGNITEIQDAAQPKIFFNNAVVSASSRYVYDAIYRLIQGGGREHAAADSQPEYDYNDLPRIDLPQPGDGQAMRNYIEQYQYDSVGNILRVVHQANNGNWTRRYESDSQSNRLLSTSLPGDVNPPYSAKYTYDAHGNMTRMPHLPRMTWDEHDHLQSTTRQVVNVGMPETTSYAYDSAGQRVRKATARQAAQGVTPTRKSERIYLGPFDIYREYDVDGTTVTLERETLHVMDDRQRVAVVETRTTGKDAGLAQLFRYQYSNHLGSAALELDDQADVISYEEYFPYGSTSYQAVRNQTETPKRYRYTGKERDEKSDLYYHGARYYAPWLGRWTSVDPAGTIDGPNLFVYCRSNPSHYLDPTGTEAGDPKPPIEHAPFPLDPNGLMEPEFITQENLTKLENTCEFQDYRQIQRVLGAAGPLDLGAGIAALVHSYDVNGPDRLAYNLQDLNPRTRIDPLKPRATPKRLDVSGIGPVAEYSQQSDLSFLQFTGKASVDVDGTGPYHGDKPNLLPDKLKISADVVPYAVISKSLLAQLGGGTATPTALQQGYSIIPLGSIALIQRGGQTFAAEVRDAGPLHSTGEVSYFLAGQIGNRGRDKSNGPTDRSARDVTYTFFASGQVVAKGGPHTVANITAVARQVLRERLQTRADELFARALGGI